MNEVEVGMDVRRFQPYPEYKDSGVEWLGQIPIEWDIIKLKRLFNVLNGATPKSSDVDFWDGDIPWATPDDLGTLTSSEITVTRRNISELGYRSCGTQLVSTGSLILSTRAPIGHIAIAGISLCTNQGCRALAPISQLSERFYYYLLLAARTELESLGQGSTFRELSTSKLESFLITLPSFDEQIKVAALLDYETSKIDALIAKKERLIELLKEQRSAVISHAVTKGLGPSVEMKDSGVEWLGKIPTHWSTKELRFAFHFLNNRRIPLSSEERSYMPKVYPYYGASGVIDHVEEYIFDESLILIAEDGANLFSRSSPLAFIAEGKYWVNNHAHILRPRTGPIKYWEGLLQAIQYDPWITGSAQPKLTKENLGSIHLPVPPIAEQYDISIFITDEALRINALISKITEAIERLQEYRTAAIAAAVTGKIDVREEI